MLIALDIITGTDVRPIASYRQLNNFIANIFTFIFIVTAATEVRLGDRQSTRNLALLHKRPHTLQDCADYEVAAEPHVLVLCEEPPRPRPILSRRIVPPAALQPRVPAAAQEQQPRLLAFAHQRLHLLVQLGDEDKGLGRLFNQGAVLEQAEVTEASVRGGEDLDHSLGTGGDFVVKRNAKKR